MKLFFSCRQINKYTLIRLFWLIILVLVTNNSFAAQFCEKRDKRWSEQENRVLHLLCNGKQARAADKDEPILSAKFLRELLEQSATEPVFAKQGIKIYGAKVKESLDWSGLVVNVPLALDRVLFEEKVSLSYASFPSSLSFDESEFKKPLRMNGTTIGRYFMARGCTMNSLDLRGAYIKGPAYLSGTNISGKLDMHRVKIDRSLTLDSPVKYKDSNKRRSGVPGEDKIGIFQSRVILEGAAIGDLLDLRGSQFDKPVNMRRVSVGKSLLARSNATFKDVLILQGATVFGLVDLSGSYFKHGVDLSNAKISEDLVIGMDDKGQKACSKWGDNAWLRLTNAHVFTLRDKLCSTTSDLKHWPNNISLTGFRYDLLSGADQEDAAVFAGRDSKWLIAWLELQQQYSPEPYKQLANVLKSNGYVDTSQKVLIESKYREMRTTNNYFQKINLALQWVFIGFGYGYWRVAAWMLVATLMGAGLLHFVDKPLSANFLSRIFYSLDRLMPVVGLSNTHFEPELPVPVCYYFFVHRLFGFVLTSYLVAGITGIAEN